jgi:hypothetical protein
MHNSWIYDQRIVATWFRMNISILRWLVALNTRKLQDMETIKSLFYASEFSQYDYLQFVIHPTYIV